MIQVDMPKQQPSGLGKLLGIGAGILTGNPMMIAGGVTQGTPAGNLLGMYNMASGFKGSGNTNAPSVPSTEQSLGSTAPELGKSEFGGSAPSLGVGETSDFGDSVSRRLMNNPQNQISAGMQALYDPNVNPEFKAIAAPSYFQSQYLNGKNLFTDVAAKSPFSGGF